MNQNITEQCHNVQAFAYGEGGWQSEHDAMVSSSGDIIALIRLGDAGAGFTLQLGLLEEERENSTVVGN